jgi:predicted transcriptional regulator
MSEEKTRVEFNAPKSLVERIDTVAEVLDIPRARLLIDALENKLDELANEETFRRRLSNAYYGDRTDYDTVKTILGREETMRLKLLRESIDQTSAIPQLKDDLPSDDSFYDGGVAEWNASSSSESSDSV